jgi:hypothetical protein
MTHNEILLLLLAIAILCLGAPTFVLRGRFFVGVAMILAAIVAVLAIVSW